MSLLKFKFCLTLLISLSVTGQIAAQYLESSKALGVDHISINPNLIGGGVVSFDYNNDGWQDLYFTSGTNKDVLYKNINGQSFDKVDLPELAFTSRYNTSGVISGDFNNDGCDDLYVTTLSIDQSLLFINNCDESFSLEFINLVDEDNNFVSSVGGFAADFNADGLLDIYTFNYVKEHNFLTDTLDNIIGYDHDCYRNSILINKGDFNFEQMPESFLKGSNGCTLAGASSRFLGSDYNGAYVVNDFGEWIYPNQVLDISTSTNQNLDASIYGMGIGIGDIDNDQDYDLYLTNIGKNKLMLNENGTYVDLAAEYNVENEFAMDTLSAVSWGSMIFDFDNDSYADLFVSNGYVPVADFLSSSIINENKFYRNVGSGFEDITERIGLFSLGLHRGAIYTDLNNDGRLDIVVTATSDSDLGVNDSKRSKIFINEIESDNNYVQLSLEGKTSSRNGYNAEAKVYFDSTVLSQILLSGTSHASQNFSALHFGLGETIELDSIKIWWPDGSIDKHTNIHINQRLLAIQGNEELFIQGCTQTAARNYNSIAQIDSGCILTTSNQDIDDAHSSFKVFPLPAIDKLSISFSGETSIQITEIRIIDVLGKLVSATTSNLNSRLTEIPLQGFYPGTFFIQVYTKNGLIGTQKFVVN